MPLTYLNHPLLQYKISKLRDTNINCHTFRQITEQIAEIMTIEALKDIPTEAVTISTWSGPTSGIKINEQKLTIVPILRAGIGMLNGVLHLLNDTPVSILGMYRNEDTLTPTPYYEKCVKNIADCMALVIDPMLATGGSLSEAISFLKSRGCKKIKAMVIVAAPEGIKKISTDHPDIDLYVGALDDHLNQNGYIIPGLGDAGDKIFGTI